MNNYIIVLDNEVYEYKDLNFDPTNNKKLFDWFLIKYPILQKQKLVDIFTIEHFVEAFNIEYFDDGCLLILCTKDQLPTKILNNHELLTLQNLSA